MATNYNKGQGPYKPEIELGTFFSATDSNSLMQIVVWDGRIGLKFKKLGRDSQGNYDKDSSVAIPVYLKSYELMTLSTVLDDIVKDRTTKYLNGESYSEFDKPLEFVSEKYNSNTGEKYIKHNMRIITVDDDIGVKRVALHVQNSKESIELSLFTTEDRVSGRILNTMQIDKKDIPLMEFAAFIKNQVKSNNAQSNYKMMYAFSNYIINSIKGGGNNSSNETSNNTDVYSGGYDSSDDDAPF